MALPPKPLDPKTARLRAARLARDNGRPKISANAHYRVYGMADEVPFGKYKGKTIADILDEDIGYLTWLLSETNFQLSEDAEQEYQARFDPRRPRGVWVD